MLKHKSHSTTPCLQYIFSGKPSRIAITIAFFEFDYLGNMVICKEHCIFRHAELSK
jgi:hypothetical protein